MFILPLLIILEAILWIIKIDPPGDTTWLQWLWLTLGFYLLLGEGVVGAVRNRVNRNG